MGHSNHSGVEGRSGISTGTLDGAQDAMHQRFPDHVSGMHEAQREVERRSANIQELQSEVQWYKGWADTYWQQLQHMSAAAAALSQQQAISVSQHQQQAAALAQYQMHMQAAVEVGRAVSAALPPPKKGTPSASAADGDEGREGPPGAGCHAQPFAAATASGVSET